MIESKPCPPSVLFACWLQLIFSACAIVNGLFAMNGTYYQESGPYVLLLSFVAPPVSGVLAVFMLKAKGWARFCFWLIYGPFVIWLTVLEPSSMTLAQAFCFVLSAIYLLTPNAHWFFKGRNYKQRKTPRPAAGPVRSYSGSRQQGYEY